MTYTIEYQVVDYTAMMAGYGYTSKLSSTKWIIAHETANNTATIDNEVRYMKTNASNAFVTHFVGGGGRIIQVAPVGKVCWGAGATANSCSYAQIELCRAKDQATFQKDYAAYVWLLRKLADECGIPKTLDTEAYGIKSHAWVSAHYPAQTNHTDPYGYLSAMGISKAQFATDIANGIGATAATAPVAAPVVTAPAAPETTTTNRVLVKSTLHLPADAVSWRVYRENGPYAVGSEVGTLAPSKFGGLTYTIQGDKGNNIVVIDTQSFGRVGIYVAPGTGATITQEWADVVVAAPASTTGAWVPENGTFTADRSINVRTGPSTANTTIVATYDAGESVVYDSWMNDGHYVWIHYVSYSGANRYMVVRENGAAWGIFS